MPDKRMTDERLAMAIKCYRDATTEPIPELLAALEAEREEVQRLEKLLKRALPALQAYSRENPRWFYVRDNAMQDPNGVHALLEELERP